MKQVKMMSLLSAFVVLLSAAACGSNTPPPPPEASTETGSAPVASAPSEPAAQAGGAVRGYTLISEICEYNPRVTAIAIEYDKELQLAVDLVDRYEVTAQLDAVSNYAGEELPDSIQPKAPREIVRAYTSDGPNVGVMKKGNYVILELDPYDENASAVYLGYSYIPEGGEKGQSKEILPYGDKMIYEVRQTLPVKYADGSLTSTGDTFQQAGYQTQIVDDFTQHLYESETPGLTYKKLAYNLYQPEAEEGETYPLIVFLHGSASRSNNLEGHDETLSPLYNNQGGITWVKNAPGPAYVFVPQYFDYPDVETNSINWSHPDITTMTMEVVQQFLDDPSMKIDPNRIYISGLSIGGRGSWTFLRNPEYSDYFAGALILCGSGGVTAWDVITDEELAQLKAVRTSGLPVWLYHNDTDPTVPVAGSRNAYKVMLDIPLDAPMPEPTAETEDYRYYESADGKIKYTELKFKPDQVNDNLGIYTPVGHWVWENTFKNKEVIAWLFEQNLQNRAPTAFPG